MPGTERRRWYAWGSCCLLRSSLEVELEGTEDGVVLLDQGKVDLDALAHVGVGERLGHALAVHLVGDLRGRGIEVVLVMRVLDVSEQVRASADQVGAATEQITGGPHLGWVDVGLGEHPPAE